MKVSYLRAVFIAGALFAGADSARSGNESDAAAVGPPALEHETVKRLLRARDAINVEQEDRAVISSNSKDLTGSWFDLFVEMAKKNPVVARYLEDLKGREITYDGYLRLIDLLDRKELVDDGTQKMCFHDHGLFALNLMSYLCFRRPIIWEEQPIPIDQIVKELQSKDPIDAAIAVQIAIEDPLTTELAVKVEKALFKHFFESSSKPDEMINEWVREMDKLPSVESKRLLSAFGESFEEFLRKYSG